jgi:hypothetical protein
VGFRDSLVPKVSTKTANNDLKTIKMLFRAARRDEYIDVDPAEFVPVLKRDSNALARRPFTLPELRRVLEIADQEWQCLILFGLYTGNGQEWKVAQGAGGRKTMGFVPLGTCVRKYHHSLDHVHRHVVAVFAIAKSNRNNSKKVLGTRKEPAEIHLCVVRPVGETE